MAELDTGRPTGTNVEVVTSYTLSATGPDGSKRTIGTAVSFNPSERRGMTYNFVIGNNPPDRARDLIPGTITESTLSVNYVAVYLERVIQSFGGTSASFLESLSDQSRPFDVTETSTEVANGATGTVRTTIYKDCYISDYRSTRDIGRGDIRVIEDVTIHYTATETTRSTGATA